MLLSPASALGARRGPARTAARLAVVMALISAVGGEPLATLAVEASAEDSEGI